MNSDTIVPFIEGRPFIPFQMHLVDGRVFRVPHSDYVGIERFALAVVIYDDQGLKEIIDVGLIVSLKLLQKVA